MWVKISIRFGADTTTHMKVKKPADAVVADLIIGQIFALLNIFDFVRCVSLVRPFVIKRHVFLASPDYI